MILQNKNSKEGTQAEKPIDDYYSEAVWPGKLFENS